MIDSTQPDPRAARDVTAEADVRPIVERPRAGLSSGAIAVLAALAGLLLFGVLEARRRNATAPAVTERAIDAAGSAALPPLFLPPALPEQPLNVPPAPAPMPTPLISRERPVLPPMSSYAPTVQTYSPPVSVVPPAPRSASGSALVLDNGSAAPSPTGTPAEGGEIRGSVSDARSSFPSGRARAGMLANRATTVPQGTLIPAVLETAFDSTNPGFARALVQRDIHGFDGSQVLIPRGSRLIGEYGADVAQGQKRAIILWTRLIRPDGATIALLSPATDTLGRGGVRASVNTHFLERFSGAILQSVLDVGVALAAQSSNSPVVVALPGSIGGLGRTTTQPTTIKPTLKVPAGRSVSIFVARDLDFTGTDREP